MSLMQINANKKVFNQNDLRNSDEGEQRVDVEELFMRALGVERKYAGKLLTIASELIV